MQMYNPLLPRRRVCLPSRILVSAGITKLYERGWIAPDWPVEYGGTGWTALQKYIFEKECSVVGAPKLPVMGMQLLGPSIYTFGTDAQKENFVAAHFIR